MMFVTVLFSCLVDLFQEESSEHEEKEGAGKKLQITVAEDGKNSVCNDRHEVHKASKDNSGERNYFVNPDPSSSSTNINAWKMN